MSLEEKNMKIKQVGLMGSLLNGLLFSFKLTVGILSGSAAMLSDAFNNLSDLLNTIITYIALRWSLKPADEDHPFGHERFEIIAGFSVSLIMMILSIESIRTGIEALIHHQSVRRPSFIFMVSVFSIVLKSILMIVYSIYSKKIDSKLLKANALDSLFDVLISFSIILGINIQPLIKVNIDGLLGIGIGIIIFFTAISLLKDFVSSLLGEVASDEEIGDILNILDENKEIAGYHDLTIHSYGKFHRYALVHIEVDQDMSLIQAHRIIDQIEDQVLHQTGINLDVHLDPMDLRSPEIKKAVNDIKAILRSLHLSIDFHDVRLDVDHLGFEVFNPPISGIQDELILEMLKSNFNDYQLVVKFEHVNLIRSNKINHKKF